MTDDRQTHQCAAFERVVQVGRPFNRPARGNESLCVFSSDAIVLGLLLSLGFYAVNSAFAQDFSLSPSLTGTNVAPGWSVNRLLTEARYQRALWRTSSAQTWTSAKEGGQELLYRGQPLSKFLCNRASTGTNELTLDELLTLKQLITGEEPTIVTYELPISRDVLADVHGSVSLIMDTHPEGPYEIPPDFQECRRAQNGNCLLRWNTFFELPGQHAMQAHLRVPLENPEHELEVNGPPAAYWSSNLCQLATSSNPFYAQAFFNATLVESNGLYRIEIQSLSGAHVKALTGLTTNGVIRVTWDLLDELGHPYTNNSFVSLFRIQLPGSGRTQTLKQQQNRFGTAGY